MNTHKLDTDTLFSAQNRKYLYAVSIPLIALLVGLGVLADGHASLILNLVSAVLGVGTSSLAVANTHPTDSEG